MNRLRGIRLNRGLTSLLAHVESFDLAVLNLVLPLELIFIRRFGNAKLSPTITHPPIPRLILGLSTALSLSSTTTNGMAWTSVNGRGNFAFTY